MTQDEVVEADEATLTPEMADAWAKVFLGIPTNSHQLSLPTTVLETEETQIELGNRRSFVRPRRLRSNHTHSD